MPRDGLLRSARNDGRHTSAFPRLTSPEVFISFRASPRRGRREHRVRAAPAVSCAKEEVVRTRAYRAAESIRHSLRNGFTAYNVISPVSHALLPPSTPTSGRQDHTSLPYAFAPFAIGTTSVHRHP